MQYREFGKTGVRVSTLGFGAMRLPAGEDGKVDLEKSVPILRRGIDLGINYIDSAWGYINGTSEIAVGQAIKSYGREKLYIATKIPVHSAEEAEPGNWRRKLETQLKRFDTPYIDFIHFHGLHWADFIEHISKPGSTLDAARKAQAEGLIRHVSFSSHDDPANIIKLIDTGEFASMLVQYNYLDRHNEEAIAHAHAAGMGTVVMGPIAGGRLVLPQGIKVGGELEMRTPELALRYVWNNPTIDVALSGMNTLAMVEENAASAARLAVMSEAENAAVVELLERNQKLADLYCTGCSYCLPCPNDINIPENFRYMNWYKVWGMEKEAKAAYAKLGSENNNQPWGVITGLKAEYCAQCGECLPKCPQNIQIVDQLAEVAATLA